MCDPTQEVNVTFYFLPKLTAPPQFLADYLLTVCFLVAEVKSGKMTNLVPQMYFITHYHSATPPNMQK